MVIRKEVVTCSPAIIREVGRVPAGLARSLEGETYERISRLVFYRDLQRWVMMGRDAIGIVNVSGEVVRQGGH